MAPRRWQRALLAARGERNASRERRLKPWVAALLEAGNDRSLGL